MQRTLDPAQIEAFATQRVIPRVRLPDPATVFSHRAERLRELSEDHALGDYLRLMAMVADAQQDALTTLITRPTDWQAVLFTLCDTIAAAPGFPAAVAATCQRIQESDPDELEEQADLLLTATSQGADTPNVDTRTAPFMMAALQVQWVQRVCALSLDGLAEHLGSTATPGVCPACGSLPVASIVRADKAYQDYRYLHCALCATEWHLVRVKCSNCQSTAGIHYHSIEGGAPAVRAESCDGCKTYRKICYQEHDIHVEPLADDLGSVALDLLMSEEGFRRSSGNPLLWQATET